VKMFVFTEFLSPNTAKKLGPKQKQYKLFAVTYHDGKAISSIQKVAIGNYIYIYS